MANKCSAPGCRSNYDGEPYTPVFKLPQNNDNAQEWLHALHRVGISDLKCVYVCAKHFRPEDVITDVDMPQPDGSIIKVKRRPILRDNACPCFLPNCPTYLSSHPTSTQPKRLDPDHIDLTHFKTALKYSQEEYEIEQKKFAVDSFDLIKSKLIHQEFSPNWLIWYPSSAEINLIKPSTSGDAISITSSIKIDNWLTVKGFVHNTQIPLSVSSISDVRQVYTLMTEIEGYKRNSFECNILAAVKWLRTAKLNLENLDEISDENSHYLPSLEFVLSQLENLLVSKTRRKYDLITMFLALKCQIISPACNTFLHTQEYLILPHHNTLRRLYTSIGLEDEFISYLKVSTK